MKYFANSEVYLRTLKLNYKTDKELPMVTEENVFILSKYPLKYLGDKGDSASNLLSNDSGGKNGEKCI